MRGEEELRAGAVTYLCVLANEDVGEKLAGAVADEGGEQLEPDGDVRLASFERPGAAIAAAVALTRSAPRSGLEALTPSERRVAEMAASELSNKEIAQALFVTVKTVEVHLSSVYRKLEIASRRQLPTALVRTHDALTGLPA